MEDKVEISAHNVSSGGCEGELTQIPLQGRIAAGLRGVCEAHGLQYQLCQSTSIAE